MWIGHGDQPTDVEWSHAWDGLLDEVRISSVARDPAWITAAYRNQVDPARFVSVGPVEPASSFCPR